MGKKSERVRKRYPAIFVELHQLCIRSKDLCSDHKLYLRLASLKGIVTPAPHPNSPMVRFLLLKYQETGILEPYVSKAVPKQRAKQPQVGVASKAFLKSYEWWKLRYQALKRSDGSCCLCGRGKQHGAVLNVDHIKPRRTHPHLALSLDNLQVLCDDCNHGKGNWDSTDWR